MIVARSAERYGVKPGLVADGRTLTYQDLNGRCNRVAGGLQGLGAQLGDRVSMYSPNRWEWLVAYRAALRIGAVVNHQRGADAGRSGLRAQRLRRDGDLHCR